jgi:hypothetical protein
MKTTTHPAAINLVTRVLHCIPITSKGTYNIMDPTHYEKGSISVAYSGKQFELKLNDCTWGISLKVIHKGKTIGDFYSTREGIFNKQIGKWENHSVLYYHQRNRGILKLLAILNKNLTPWELPCHEYGDDPMGCPAMYI